MTDPKRLESHFAFGENWQSFLSTVTEESVGKAVQSLERLLPAPEISGRSFFDIGCGSGLSMLAAAKLGASSVDGVDIDPRAVTATQTLLSRHLPNEKWRVRVASVFDLPPPRGGEHSTLCIAGACCTTPETCRPRSG